MVNAHVLQYISATVPELARHEVGVVVHRAKRVRRCQRPTINDSKDQRSMMPTMDWSTIVIRAARPSGQLPLACLKSLFRLPTSASKLDAFSKPKNHQKSPKKLPKSVPRPLQNGSKTTSYVAKPEILKKCNPSIRKPHF